MHHNLLLVLVVAGCNFYAGHAGTKTRKFPILYFWYSPVWASASYPASLLITIDPDLIFLIFLPPLLYEAAWYTSWHDFWQWRRPIGMLAFGLVFCTLHPGCLPL